MERSSRVALRNISNRRSNPVTLRRTSTGSLRVKWNLDCHPFEANASGSIPPASTNSVFMTESHCNAIQPDEASAFVDRALGRLRDAGLRITGARKQVVQVLATTRKPIGAYGIRDRVVQTGGKVDVVSVYRILTALTEIGLAHHIGSVDGYLACSAGYAHEHETQHLICSSCGCVEEMDIPGSAMEAIDGAGNRGGFKRIRARVEVLGTCSHCS